MCDINIDIAKQPPCFAEVFLPAAGRNLSRERRDNTLGTRSVKTWFSDLWPVNYVLIMSPLKCRIIHEQLWLQTNRYYLCSGANFDSKSKSSQNRGMLRSKVKEGIVGRDSGTVGCARAHVTFSCEYYHEWGASPGSLPHFACLLPLLFPSWSFVCFCHRDVTVILAAPPLLGFHKASLEVGQIWLNGIKFCCYFTWMKIKPEGALEVLSPLAINMCQLPTNAGPWRKLFCTFLFLFFFSSSLFLSS